MSRKPAPLLLDQEYVNLKNQIIKAERRVLKELGFCVHVKHPHKVGLGRGAPGSLGSLPLPPETGTRDECVSLSAVRSVRHLKALLTVSLCFLLTSGVSQSFGRGLYVWSFRNRDEVVQMAPVRSPFSFSTIVF